MRTAALTMMVLIAAAGCAGAQARPVSTTTTTSAAPGDVGVYLTRARTMGCTKDLARSIHFAPGSDALAAEETADVDQWAACLNTPELRDATIVLTGGEDVRAADDDPVFVRRARAIRAELARRGVDPSRIVIAAPNAAREGGRLGANDAVIVETSSSTTLRGLRGIR